MKYIDTVVTASQSDLKEVIERVSRYAGKSMQDNPRPRNPNLTAQETIAIADYIAALESEIEDLGYEAMEANERHDC